MGRHCDSKIRRGRRQCVRLGRHCDSKIRRGRRRCCLCLCCTGLGLGLGLGLGSTSSGFEDTPTVGLGELSLRTALLRLSDLLKVLLVRLVQSFEGCVKQWVL
jgi:hypothetical protein